MPSPILHPSKTHAEKLARAKELRRQMTPGEQILWERLRGNRLDGLHFRRQHVIDGLVVDFYCHAAGLVVEVDGGIHEAEPERDAARDEILTARGLRILHIPDDIVLIDPDSSIAQIRAACRLRNLSQNNR